MDFVLHPKLAADTFHLGDFPLCRLLMLDDAQYPWFILVPRRPELREIHGMAPDDRLTFWNESAEFSETVMAAFSGEKLNVAALGNMVPQLHIHHIVRFSHDPAWPAPVWGAHPPNPFSPVALKERVEQIVTALPKHFKARALGDLNQSRR